MGATIAAASGVAVRPARGERGDFMLLALKGASRRVTRTAHLVSEPCKYRPKGNSRHLGRSPRQLRAIALRGARERDVDSVNTKYGRHKGGIGMKVHFHVSSDLAVALVESPDVIRARVTAPNLATLDSQDPDSRSSWCRKDNFI